MTGGFWTWDWKQVDLDELLAQWGEFGHDDLDADGVISAKDLGLLSSRMR